MSLTIEQFTLRFVETQPCGSWRFLWLFYSHFSVLNDTYFDIKVGDCCYKGKNIRKKLRNRNISIFPKFFFWPLGGNPDEFCLNLMFFCIPNLLCTCIIPSKVNISGKKKQDHNCKIFIFKLIFRPLDGEMNYFSTFC